MGCLIHEELSRDILAAAMKVHSTLRPGLDEKLYENALVIELAKRSHRAEQQKSFSVHYDGHFIGKMTPDLIVDDLVIVDPKVVDGFNQDHFAQMLGHLAITGFQLAMLINFKHASLRWKRILNSDAEPGDDDITM
jgi:GxxExxY protein